MNHEFGIIDTNIVILLPRLAEQVQVLPTYSSITAVTLAELAAGPSAAKSEEERVIRHARFVHAQSNFEVLPFDAAAARAFATVSESLRAAGRKRSARAYDALIAAIAISKGLPLFTVNPDDFAGISLLQLESIPHPG